MPTLRALPALRDNYIWLLADTSARTALVVDPGEARPVLDVLASDGLGLTAILLTHHHADHIGGTLELVGRFPGAIVYGPHDPRIPGDVRWVGDGDTVQVDSPSSRFEVIEVHGHTRSHIAYFGEDLVFCGDTLFSLGCGRLFEGTPAEMLASLDRLAALPGNTRVCCGHEYTLANAAFALTVEPDNPALETRIREARELRDRGQPTLPSLIDDERAANPFLRVDVLRMDAIFDQGPADSDALASPQWRVERFAALRMAKDNFRT